MACGRSLAADLVEPALQTQAIQRCNWQAHEDADAVLERAKGVAECLHLFDGAAVYCRWIVDTPVYGWLCFDPVWDKKRVLDLIDHFSTAFLLDTLKGDKAAHAALLPDAVNFPGIEYATTMK